jgi:hypothetical protein
VLLLLPAMLVNMTLLATLPLLLLWSPVPLTWLLPLPLPLPLPLQPLLLQLLLSRPLASGAACMPALPDRFTLQATATSTCW